MICKQRIRIFQLALLLAIFAGRAKAEAPATQPSGSVTGKITSPGEVPLSEMVVYLESPDARRPAVTPTAHAAISQKGAKFSPPLLIVCVGQTVDFLNDEDRPIDHNVFSNAPAKRFDLGLYKPGESRSVVFDKPGPVFLYCSIHRYMDGVIFVSPTPYSSLVALNGSYKIDNVPPGIWMVKTWQRRRRFPELSVPVLLDAGKSATVDLELRKK
jgi:plastocyanin